MTDATSKKYNELNCETESQKKRKAYMKTYMSNRYYADVEKSRAYLKSSKCKNVNNLDATELKKYGGYLADIHKLRQILKILPIDLFNEILNELRETPEIAGTYGSPHAPPLNQSITNPEIKV